MAAVRKPKHTAPTKPVGEGAKSERPVSEIGADETAHHALPSPARLLQAHLKSQYSPLLRYMTGRFVTLGLMFTTLGTVLAGSLPMTVL